MNGRPRFSLLLGVLTAFALIAGSVAVLRAQTPHRSGQSVQPVFEGWQRNPDGTFDMIFGYLNRNYEEQPECLIGESNAFSPGPVDRGQPTHFYPRRQSFVFKVTVPADWGDKRDLVWTLTCNGQTAKAYGSLWPVWTLDKGVWQANRTGSLLGREDAEGDPNKPPKISAVGQSSQTIALGSPLTLAVTATDDGLPGLQKRPTATRARDAEIGQPLKPGTGLSGVPGTAPGIAPMSQDKVSALAAQETGLAVTWLHYRGAGTVTFNPGVVAVRGDGKASTSVSFSQRGTYVVRAVADDGIYTTPVDITISVR
jgi:hypothetical protein